MYLNNTFISTQALLSILLSVLKEARSTYSANPSRWRSPGLATSHAIALCNTSRSCRPLSNKLASHVPDGLMHIALGDERLQRFCRRVLRLRFQHNDFSEQFRYN